jgi:hypothetical protein
MTTFVIYSQTITVTNPNSGTVWYIGGKAVIKWTNNGNTGTHVKINIFRNSIAQSNFKLQIKCSNTGLKKWIIPNSFTPGKYIIRIKGVDNNWNDTGIHGDSALFSIKNRFSKIENPKTVNGVISGLTKVKWIKVLSPNGRERWEIGKKQMIRWKSSNNIGAIKIIVKNNILNYPIVNTIDRKNSYLWQVSKNIRIGQYKLLIKSNDGKILDESDNVFEIIPPLVDLTCTVMSKAVKKKTGWPVSYTTWYLRFKIIVRNKGRKVLHNVLFNWKIYSKDQNKTMYEDGAGFATMTPNTAYETDWMDYAEGKYERYTLYVFVDPDNRQGEFQSLRYDNNQRIDYVLNDLFKN